MYSFTFGVKKQNVEAVKKLPLVGKKDHFHVRGSKYGEKKRQSEK